MKTIGILLFLAGVLMTLYTGFTYVTEEEVVDLGDVEVTREDEHTVTWQPFFGIGTMIIGTVVLVIARKTPSSK